MTQPTPETVALFADFVARLRADGWTPMPVDTTFAGYVAVRSWPDGTWDTLIVHDLDTLYAHREPAPGLPAWNAHGTLHAVRRALAALPPPAQS